MLNTNELMMMLSTNRVYVDFSAFNSPDFIIFLKRNYKKLLSNRIKLYMPLFVMERLKNIAENTRLFDSKNAEAKLKILNYLEKKGIVELVGDSKDYSDYSSFALELLSELPKQKCVVITNDDRFSEDLVTMNTLSALKCDYLVTVYRVNKGGRIGYYNRNMSRALKEAI